MADESLPPLTLAKIMQLVESDRMELAEAMNKAVEDAQKEAQAAQQQPEARAVTIALFFLSG